MAGPAQNKTTSVSEQRRLSWHLFKRDSSGKWTFSGQQPGEEVVMVVRRHWWFLVQPALPLIVSTVVFLGAIWASFNILEWGAYWPYVIGLAFLAMIGTGIWFAYKDLVVWWYETYTITNKRILNSRGLLEPKRQETPLDQIQQIGMDIDKFHGLLFGFGTLRVYLTGSDFYIRDVPRPRQVREALQGISDAIKAKKVPPPPEPKIQDPSLQVVLDSLVGNKPVEPLPDVDAHLPPLRFKGPRRTFGGILHIPCNVRYDSGEYTVKYVQRSRYVLYRNLIIPALIVLIVFPTMVLTPATGWLPDVILSYWWGILGLVILGALVAAGLVYANYVDDVYILTNRRIIDIQRFFIFFAENNQEVEYKNIQNIEVRVNNVIERFLDVGDVFIETPGSNPNIILSNVDDPFKTQDEIAGIRAHRERSEAASKQSAETKTLYKWFNTILIKLEETTRTRGVPDLRGMDLISAIAYAQEMGLDVVVRDEAVVRENVPPGQVVLQNPPPGTMMEKGSNIEVVLSKRSLTIDTTLAEIQE